MVVSPLIIVIALLGGIMSFCSANAINKVEVELKNSRYISEIKRLKRGIHIVRINTFLELPIAVIAFTFLWLGNPRYAGLGFCLYCFMNTIDWHLAWQIGRGN